jgi:glycosyltransferase involved in cell wall biosynthesis
MTKPKILLITDVWGWGGHHRGEQIVKYLSDEFELELITQAMLNKAEHKYKLNDYNLYYPLFHVQLRLGKLHDRMDRVVTVVTGRTALKAKFAEYGPNAKVGFLKFANQCRAIFANNYLALRELRTYYKGTSIYVPRGVDEELFSYSPYPRGKFAACFVGKGRMPEKGYGSHIIPACVRTNTKMISNIKNYRNAVTQDKVKEQIYDKANVLMVASTVDGTPNPALEAASCGRPILSNKIGNMPEFIEQGVNGFLVRRNIEDYADKLRWMKNNPDKCEKMGMRARQKIEDEWCWRETLNRYERKALRRVLK